MAQQNFCVEVRNKLTNYFFGANKDDRMEVLDFGSLDVNGNNRFLFFNYNYTGVDIGEGPNVDVVSRAHEFSSDILYDVVMSTEMLEHDMHWKESLINMESLLKPNGMMLITCASTGRPEHGTLRTEGPEAFSSPLTSQIEEWMNYYKNLTEDDFRSVWDVEKIFKFHQFFYAEGVCDLYFVGIKKDA